MGEGDRQCGQGGYLVLLQKTSEYVANFFVAKNFRFFENYGVSCPHGQGEDSGNVDVLRIRGLFMILC